MHRQTFAALAASLATHTALAQVSVTTQHNDNLRTGANLDETVLTPANVNPTQFGKLYSVPLDGQVYTQPLYVANVAIPGQGSHNVVYVATMNNSVYALDADDGGKQIWKSNFGQPVHPCDVEWHENVTQGSSVGILGTPVIDVTTNTIYFVSRNEANFNPQLCNWNSAAQSTGVNQGVFTQFLNALDITTGAAKFGSPVQIKATYTSADGTLSFDPQTQNQRTALTLANGDVYVAYASHDDLGAYHGWIISYKAATLVQDKTYSDTTTGTKGGIWQAGQGLTVDGSGNLLVSTGNGEFMPSAKGVNQTGNSFVKLSPSLTLLDWFTPSNSVALNNGDQDLGSSGVLSIPGTTLLAGGGKQGRMYIVDTTNMGHFDPAADSQVKQEFQAIMGAGTQHIHGTPIYFNSQAAGPIVYVWGENDFLRAFSFDGTKQQLVTPPRAMSTMTAPETNNNGAMPGGFLSISANGGTNGIIWAATPFAADASQATVEGVLHAFDAITLQELWNDKQNKPRDGIGNFAKFVPPTVANGKLFVPNFGALGSADGSGSLNVYGLLPGGGQTPLVPNGSYSILSRFSQLVIDDPALSGAGGTVMQQWSVNGGPNQSWQLTNVSNNVVSLINKSSGMALEVAAASRSNSALVDQSPYTGSPAQLWNVVSAGDGFYELTNVNSGQALDVDGGVTTEGAKIDQFPYKSVAWQQWSFN
jgi:hypothetical protein